jgi:hypothetical protein
MNTNLTGRFSPESTRQPIPCETAWRRQEQAGLPQRRIEPNEEDVEVTIELGFDDEEECAS